jgi:DNA-3-methyladenine glycosylase I
MSDVPRCSWAVTEDKAMQAYHDTEWGVPEHDDGALFELLTLEGAQAGLSWRTVLARRAAYRAAYHGFDIDRVAAMTDAELEALIADSPLIRNRLKIYSVRSSSTAAWTIISGPSSITNRSATPGPIAPRCQPRPKPPMQ